MELPEPKPSEETRKALKAEKRRVYAENKKRVIEHLQDRGLSRAAISGIVGNIDVETGGSFDYRQRQTQSGSPSDPRTIEGGGYGLFQFDDPKNKKGHESWYKEYLEQTGKKDSAESQLDYFLDMISAGEDSKSPFYKYAKNIGAGNAATIKAYLETSDMPIDISDAITDRYLKPGIQHSDKRRTLSQKTFEELKPTDKADSFPSERVFDVPEDKSMYEKVKPYIPILRHFNEGGVAMEEQMEMFQDGGLRDEGGMIDEVSGNDVPPGSLREEVRDDIPAQLSKGEFVFPADVVRYWGLDTLMKMRQEAKMGLKQMEAMGQMGNSDEATMPDDLPFDINDLDIEDEMGDNNEMEMAQGGVVHAANGTYMTGQTGISGYRPSAFQQGVGGYTQYQMPQYSQQAMPQQYVPAQPQFTPVQPVPTTLPKFEEFVPKQQVETLQYINPTTGETRTFTFINGKPTVTIPEGFIPMSEYTPEETAAVPETQVQTTRVTREEGDGDAERQRREEEMYGPGGGRLGIGGDIYGVSFDMPEGFIPGTMGVAGTAFNLATGRPISADATVKFKRGDVEFSVSGTDYNDLKFIIEDEPRGANSNKAVEKLKELQKKSYEKDVREKQQKIQELEEESRKARKERMESYAADVGFTKAQQKAIGKEAAEIQQAKDKESTSGYSKFADRDYVFGSGYKPEGDGGGGASSSGTSKSDWGSEAPGGQASGTPWAVGGLASKPKPKKTKKMKQGGLASKK